MKCQRTYKLYFWLQCTEIIVERKKPKTQEFYLFLMAKGGRLAEKRFSIDFILLQILVLRTMQGDWVKISTRSPRASMRKALGFPLHLEKESEVSWGHGGSQLLRKRHLFFYYLPPSPLPPAPPPHSPTDGNSKAHCGSRPKPLKCSGPIRRIGSLFGSLFRPRWPWDFLPPLQGIRFVQF